MASHEFRNPLSTVLAAAQLMENSPTIWQDSPKRLRNLHRIQNSVKHMVQLLDDILTINRAETGKLEFNPKPLALKKFCRQCVEEMQLSAGSKHTIKFVTPPQEIYAVLDEKLLRSILANLLSNGIKYSPKGGEILVSLESTLDSIQIKIQDRGIGIATEDRPKLFQPFHRGQNVRRIPGTGLGLVVVQKCINLHGGMINIDSKQDRGTIVTVTLPLNNSIS